MKFGKGCATGLLMVLPFWLLLLVALIWLAR